MPPRLEQHRIVEKVDALLAQVSKAKDRLERVKGMLKRFRQAVLGAACSGKLTEDWRVTTGHTDEWRTATVEAVSGAIVDCPHSTPKWAATGEICLRTTNFLVSGLDLTEVRRVSPATYRERVSRLVPQSGDVVYSREGGILGIACVIPAGLTVCLGQRMMLMRPDPAKVESDYFCAVLNSPTTNAVVRELTGGSASPHLNVGDIRRFEVPLPSLDEQREIMTRLKTLSSMAVAIETGLTRAAMAAETLAPSILSKAFRGELVSTEAELARAEGRSLESAEEMLKRLNAENNANTAKGKKAARRKDNHRRS